MSRREHEERFQESSPKRDEHCPGARTPPGPLKRIISKHNRRHQAIIADTSTFDSSESYTSGSEVTPPADVVDGTDPPERRSINGYSIEESLASFFLFVLSREIRGVAGINSRTPPVPRKSARGFS